MNEFWQLYVVFLRIGGLTFGGGPGKVSIVENGMGGKKNT